ncbi:MAG: hypothetical protein ACFB11_23075 [Paracoccaceae bacterium]
MADKTDLNDQQIDAALDEAALEHAQPSEDFMQRVLRDALAEQPHPNVVAPPTTRWSFWQAFGGFGGLVAATCAGFVIGINPPDFIQTQFEAAVYGSAAGLSDYGASVSAYGWDQEEE